jgi:hypothetical protein
MRFDRPVILIPGNDAPGRQRVIVLQTHRASVVGLSASIA